jgi:hypothetical protein
MDFEGSLAKEGRRKRHLPADGRGWTQMGKAFQSRFQIGPRTLRGKEFEQEETEDTETEKIGNRIGRMGAVRRQLGVVAK